MTHQATVRYRVHCIDEAHKTVGSKSWIFRIFLCSNWNYQPAVVQAEPEEEPEGTARFTISGAGFSSGLFLNRMRLGVDPDVCNSTLHVLVGPVGRTSKARGL